MEIIQGCPRSPYLFVIVLTVVFEDVDCILLRGGIAKDTWSTTFPVYDLEYADDALLFTRTIRPWRTTG